MVAGKQILDRPCADILPVKKGQTREDYFELYLERKNKCRQYHKFIESNDSRFLRLVNDKALRVVNSSRQKSDEEGDFWIDVSQNIEVQEDTFFDFMK